MSMVKKVGFGVVKTVGVWRAEKVWGVTVEG